MKTSSFTLLAVALVTLFAAGAAYAVRSSTANLTISATVAEGAVLVAEPATFDSVDVTSGVSIAQAQLKVQLPSGTVAVILLDQGVNPGATSQDAVPQRQMSGPNGVKLAYTIAQANGSAWGNAADTGMDYVGTGSSKALTVTVKIVDGQNVPVGTYSDTINVTIKF